MFRKGTPPPGAGAGAPTLMEHSMAKSPSKGGSFRSAVSGRYVTPRYAASHPRTTVHEAPPKSKKRR